MRYKIVSTNPEHEIKHLKEYREDEEKKDKHIVILYIIDAILLITIGFLMFSSRDNSKNIDIFHTNLNQDGKWAWGEYLEYSKYNKAKRLKRRK